MSAFSARPVRGRTADKYDIKKARRELYTGGPEFRLVDVPELQYLAVDGSGAPGASEYVAALEALYPVAYALKFFSKKTLERDFVVAPLEGLWWADDPSVFVSRDKASWSWTMLIAQPEWILREHVEKAVDAAVRKGVASADRVRMLRLTEGRSIQVLHTGSYDDEGPTLHRLHHEFMPEHGLTFNGHHHEIYLSDARRTAPEKLKTILRQPVRPV